MRYFIMSNSNTDTHTPVPITNEMAFYSFEYPDGRGEWIALFNSKKEADGCAKEIPICDQCGWTVYEWKF